MNIVRLRIVLASLVLLGLSACRVTDWTLWKPVDDGPNPCEVERIRDIAYYDGADADRVRHRLDLFLPKGKTDFPVVVLVHGGAWVLGDNRCCGLYSTVGEYLASQGIGVVMPNYRLSPMVKHPEHIRDLAGAFAWTKKHLPERGGRLDQLFVVGHSAGGHLVALLTTDETYLKAEGCRTSDIRGVIAISGVYRIPDGKAAIELGGTTALAVRFDEMLPMRGPSTSLVADQSRSGLPIHVNIFHPAFGDDPAVREAASPVTHVRRGLPPFLLLNAEKDLPLLPAMAEEMHRVLQENGCDSHIAVIANRNHNSIIFNAIQSSDPVARAIVEFVQTHR